ncbi:histonelysine Nmethyltransferase SETMARlike [Trichonephila clavipes]|nr:histonelysine Nmethyltransferase SETMARlike [Trichonephila clavipes]
MKQFLGRQAQMTKPTKWRNCSHARHEYGIVRSPIRRITGMGDPGCVERKIKQGRPKATTVNEDRQLSIIARHDRDATTSHLFIELYASECHACLFPEDFNTEGCFYISRPHPYTACRGHSGDCNSPLRTIQDLKTVAERVELIVTGTQIPLFPMKKTEVCELQDVKNGSQQREIRYILQIFFDKGIFYLKDAPRTGRSVVKNVDKITEIIEIDRPVSSRNITQELKIDNKTVLNHLRKVEFKKKLDYGQTLNSDLYCQQLDRLKPAIDQKRLDMASRRGVVFHQDNASLYTSVVARQKLWELVWEVLMHPPYSPDLAPRDNLLFSHIAKFPE